ncbi:MULTISPECIES: hypothetical protein [Haloferax]|uniref:Lipoprotein n=2 Tax=Haloferax TaxID=2251 RepID=A0A6G1Z6Q9_9EURY|nr:MULTISPECIES: hypothetical protein [Haloferax]KAB1185059.1 hypothetical protein Hfx1149_16180 [Haloferax sp. CBA1149]MRW82236.1 hypothetical protein [Haloferax marinisediminis]
MFPRTRRQFLHASGASIFAALAGCAGEATSSGSGSSSQTPHGPRPDSLVTDYDYLELRSNSEQPIFRDTEREDDRGYSLPHFLVGSEDERAAVEVAAEFDGVDDARQFISETDFDEQGLVIIQHRVRGCYDVELLYVASTPDRIVDLEFCRVLRDAAVECSVDDRHVVASLVRLPYTVSEAMGWGHGGGRSCRLPPSLRTKTAEEEA